MNFKWRGAFSLAAIQLLACCVVIGITNTEVPDRARLLVHQGRFGVLATTAVLWVISLVAIAAAVSLKRTWLRWFWAVILAAGGAIAWGYKHASGGEISVFDILGLWEARHEAGNAYAIYGNTIRQGVILFVIGLAVFGLGFVSRWLDWRRLGALRAVLPALPIVLIAAVVLSKEGNGHYAMPKQFSQWSLGGLVFGKQILRPTPVHGEVAWKAGPGMEKILYIVDESLRADYVLSTPGNSETPHFAEFAKQMVDFGPASSGGICSSYANATLRFMASRTDMGGEINANPTIWKYAKAAGYRTVYIDAQAYTIRNETHLQNFMTSKESKSIDTFYPLLNIKAEDADRKVLEILADEMSKPGKVFILANKQGAHFPYDIDYPHAAAPYHPTQTEDGGVHLDAMLNSYRNAIHANVDGFFEEFPKRVPLANAAMIYTSDHGQYFHPGRLTHCRSFDANPEMALVPLYAMSSDPTEQQALQKGAALLQGKASHFQIASTVLSWMGYSEADLATHYHESLTAGTSETPAFTIGDIFGLFSSKVNWLPIDLTRKYRDDEATLISQSSANVGLASTTQ